MTPIHRLLIANRGEIAVRIIQSCQRLGIHTVLAVSEADRDSMGARLADELCVIGAAPASQSYLHVERLLAAARQSRVDAVHPGYGFLSENVTLATACRNAGIAFIGPAANALRAMGDKLSARQHAEQAKLPVVPGAEVQNSDDLSALAAGVGYPVLIKAVSGGGGRGMKVVQSPQDLNAQCALAMAEAEAAFGDARIYLERYIEKGRHVEVQVLGDGNNVIHLGTRDCSIQRRYQKLLEEAPAPNLPSALREAMETAAVRFARHLDYEGAGTVEFLVDVASEHFYFLEMNARIQVEHPVTEAITGLDLVAEQIRLAEGRPLRLTQDDIRFHGHAIECRLNAEDCSADFMPSPGQVSEARFPAGPGIRIDTHIEAGSHVPPYYDSLLAKIIVHGATRQQAITRLRQALSGCTVDGVATNLPLHRLLLSQQAVIDGGMDTRFLPALLSDAPFSTTKEGSAHGRD